MTDLWREGKLPMYKFVWRWSNEDRGYIITVRELPDFSAFGRTIKQAKHEANIALSLYLEVMQEDGEEIPTPLS